MPPQERRSAARTRTDGTCDGKRSAHRPGHRQGPPRNIVSRFEAKLGNTLLFAWEPGISIAQNPYIEFTFVARESGELNMQWKDEQGQTLSAQKTISLT